MANNVGLGAMDRSRRGIDRLDEITASTLVVHGRHDQIAPFSVAREMTPAIPDGRLVSFGGGHLVSLVTHTNVSWQPSETSSPRAPDRWVARSSSASGR